MLLRGTMSIVAVLALALIAPAAATAASKPAVRTGAAASITPTTVTLNGRVDPNDAETTYFFRYGTTSLFGLTTGAAPAGSGDSFVAVSVPVTGLAPNTRYHYQLVAQNRFGITRGERKTFRTKVQPLGVTLAASPSTVPPGGATTLVGQLTGTNNAGRQVVLQSNPFPYVQGFLTTGNAHVTDGAGNFSFPVLSVPVTTQFRVLMPQRPEVISPIVFVGAALQVRTRVRKVARHPHSVGVRFRGRIRPRNPGGRVSIQKLRGGSWAEIAHTRARARSRYRKRVRLFRSGQFRVVAEAQGQYVSGAGRTITIHVPR